MGTINTVAIVGRPNVGKSTLFNRLTRSRSALVDNQPGVTRDRIFARIEYNGLPLSVIDTGGFEPYEQSSIKTKIREQVEMAIGDADKIIFVLDAKEGITPLDQEMANILRRKGKKVIVAVNKIDAPEHEALAMEFYKLGLGQVYPVSAIHGRGIKDLMEEVIKGLSKEETQAQEDDKRIKLAIIGRPNVGKSSFINKVLGEERVIVSDEPGTTRDSIDTPFSFSKREYLLIDTAGIRRRARVREKIEKFSIIKALNSLIRSHIAIVMMDAREGITEQDVHICGYAFEQGKGIVIAINKWDLIKDDHDKIMAMMDSLERRLKFVSFAPRINTSALTGENIMMVFKLVDEVYNQMNKRIKTPLVNKGLKEIIDIHPPPIAGRKRLRFYYATQVDIMPPTFVLFVNNPKWIHFSYKRFLMNQFREKFGLENSPIKLIFKEKQKGSKK